MLSTATISGVRSIELDDLGDVDKFSTAIPKVEYGLIREGYGLPYHPLAIPPPIPPEAPLGGFLYALGINGQVVGPSDFLEFTNPIALGDNITLVNNFLFELSEGHVFSILFNLDTSASVLPNSNITVEINKVGGNAGTMLTTTLKNTTIGADSEQLPLSTVVAVADTRPGNINIAVVIVTEFLVEIAASTIMIKQIV